MPVLPSLQLRQRPQAMLNGTEHDVADLDELDVRAGLDHLAGDLVPEDQSCGAVVRPRTMCWSDPQMLVVTIRRITPWGTLRPTFAG